MPAIFYPLSLSDCKILQYRTLRVAVTFDLRLELKYLEWDAFSEILLPSCLCKLLKPHLYCFTCYNIAGLLQLYFWSSQDSISSCPREKMSIWHILAVASMLHWQCRIILKIWSCFFFFFSNAFFSLSRSSVYSSFLQNKRDDCANCGVDWWTGLAGRPKRYCYAAHSDHQFGLPQKHSRVGTFGFHLGPWCTLPHV